MFDALAISPKDNFSLLVVITAIIGLSFYLQKYKTAKLIGPLIMCILLGVVFSHIGVMPHMAPIYITFIQYSMPFAIALLMLGIDLSVLRTLTNKPLKAMLSIAGSVSLVTAIISVVMQGAIGPDVWKAGGMIVGTFTGGSANLTAVAVALDTSSDLIAGLNTVDYVVGLPTLGVYFALPKLIKRWKPLQFLGQYSLPKDELIGEQQEILSETKWSVREIAILSAIAMVLLKISILISGMASKDMAGTVKIISLTTMALFVAQTPFVKKLKGAIDLGILSGLFFITSIGLMINLTLFSSKLLTWGAFYAVILVATFFLHMFVCRALKVEHEYAILSLVAGFAEGTTAALCAASNGWGKLVGIAVVMGILGAAAGNYIGLTVAWLIKGLI